MDYLTGPGLRAHPASPPTAAPQGSRAALARAETLALAATIPAHGLAVLSVRCAALRLGRPVETASRRVRALLSTGAVLCIAAATELRARRVQCSLYSTHAYGVSLDRIRVAAADVDPTGPAFAPQHLSALAWLAIALARTFTPAPDWLAPHLPAPRDLAHRLGLPSLCVRARRLRRALDRFALASGAHADRAALAADVASERAAHERRVVAELGETWDGWSAGPREVAVAQRHGVAFPEREPSPEPVPETPHLPHPVSLPFLTLVFFLLSLLLGPLCPPERTLATLSRTLAGRPRPTSAHSPHP